MITLPDKTRTSADISLEQILNCTTKDNMLKVCKKFDLYVSPNLKKEETARRISDELLDNPLEILSRLSKAELQIIDEFVKGDDNTYVVRKMRKTLYILQKYYLTATFCDYEKDEWHILMPAKLRESLKDDYKFYLDLAEQGKKGPSTKELRMMAMMKKLYGGE